jgi:hypothetical protein
VPRIEVPPPRFSGVFDLPLVCWRLKARSGWWRPNKRRVERLLAAGLMAPAGLAVVDAAKAEGSLPRRCGERALDPSPGGW